MFPRSNFQMFKNNILNNKKFNFFEALNNVV